MYREYRIKATIKVNCEHSSQDKDKRTVLWLSNTQFSLNDVKEYAVLL